MAIEGHTKEAGLEICKQLGIDPARVLSINIFVLTRTLVVKTLDGVVNCSLVEDRNAVGKLIFRIVKDGGQLARQDQKIKEGKC